MFLNTVMQWLQRGLQAHQQGNAAEASRCYQQVLASQPRHPDALHLSGVLALQAQDFKRAAALIKKAIKANPQMPDFHNNLGEALRQQGQWRAARDAFRAALKLNPQHPLSLNNLGLVLRELKQPQEARASFEQALTLRPDYFEAHLNLAQLLTAEGDDAAAIEHFRQAQARQPDYPPLLMALGNALRRSGQPQAALTCFDQLLTLQSADAAALTNRGECLLQLQRHAEARLALEEALSRDFKLAPAHNILGVVCMEQDDPEAARECFERALALDSRLTQARLNLAQIEREQRRMECALAHYDQLLAEQPALAEAHFGRAMVHLSQGRWIEGWDDYEWRFQTAFQAPLARPNSPCWDGTGQGGRLLLLTEQGLGDNLLGWRHIAALGERFDEVWLQAPAPLASLAATLPGLTGVCAVDAFAEHDLHCPLMSLPQRLAAAPDQSPALAYLNVPPARVVLWQQRLDAAGAGLRVGLCWSGSALNPKNAKRQLGLAPLSPLFELPGVQWVCLQKDISEEDRRQLAEVGVVIHDWMEEMDDFGATAALVKALDLVISLDSAVAHLAGALGQPCWTLVPFYHDWRWPLDGDHSYWYPHMRLLRQQRYGDGWDSVTAELRRRLNERLQGGDDKVAAPRELPVSADQGGVGAGRTGEDSTGPELPGVALPSGHNRLCQTREGVMLVNRFDAYIGRSLITYGEFSELELVLLRQLLQPGQQVVDAGANIGVHSLCFSRAVGDSGRVYAFEPQRLVFQTLSANLALNSRTNVYAFPCALGAVAGEARIAALDPARPANFGGVSLGEGEQTETVAVRTIDGLALSECRLIKVDVEGMELAVLQGAEQTLARCQPLLYLENDRPQHSAALVDWLHRHGYRCFRHQPALFNPANFASNTDNIFANLVSGNLLAVAESQVAECGPWLQPLTELKR